MHKLPTKWSGYAQYPHPRNVAKSYSLEQQNPPVAKAGSPLVPRERLLAQAEVRAELVGNSLRSLVPLLDRLRTEQQLENFVTEKKRAKLLSPVCNFARPDIVFSKSRPNRSSPHIPLSNNELYEKDCRVWGERNPKKQAIACDRERRDREQLEKKRRAKYPVHFSGDFSGSLSDSKSQTTTMYSTSIA